MELRVSRYTCRCVVRASNHVNPAPHPNVLINFDFDAIVKVDSILMWCDGHVSLSAQLTSHTNSLFVYIICSFKR